MSFVGRNNSKITARPSGGGNKLQGLTSTTNKRSGSIRAIKERAWGENRNLIFCLNQLGGVGRNKSQFHTPADGLNCKEGEEDYTQLYISQIKSFLNNAINNKIKEHSLENFNKTEDFQICFVGNIESFWNDIHMAAVGLAENYPYVYNNESGITNERAHELSQGAAYNYLKRLLIDDSPYGDIREHIFTHLLSQESSVNVQITLLSGVGTYIQAYISIPMHIQQKINYVNNMVPIRLKHFTRSYGTHTMGLINNNFIFPTASQTITNPNAGQILRRSGFGVRNGAPLLVFGYYAYKGGGGGGGCIGGCGGVGWG